MDDLEVQEGVVIPGWELYFTASRSGGPGGQHANKTSSRVTLHWAIASTTALTEVQRARVMRKLAGRIDDDGVLQISAEDDRSQHRNKALALERLAALVRQALVVPKHRRPTRPTKGSVRRRLDAKKAQGEKKANRSWRPEGG
ncbi:MAG: aminoacyl-tRNA hydrolase [Myxococcales bacterium]|nr:aminoacyl-tRNA hydrolase [Myxococcales bacterium]MCB9524823.1 aminoacyl-tRNA hydrolase [Myxococcales bacterium]